MDDAFGVGGVESTGDLHAEIEDGFDVEGLFRDQMLEGVALEKFHGDECAIFTLVDVVDRAASAFGRRQRQCGTQTVQGLGLAAHPIPGAQRVAIGITGMLLQARTVRIQRDLALRQLARLETERVRQIENEALGKLSATFQAD